eukprot:CAMPEP_0117420542 /NCGR_PEP_ID=MMETSP0758-20121206/1852_1 /TAXON_ID=63605 /ORGANISM="Percolomonas cosmopolitus, Strain AE-1 (ATCC 50343)" /LENGTH=306 /DNA_ID=CAMNT_0005202207 /DNA_START=45 /DNA_END=962 /DNA_ORIENTATION=+
MAYINRIDTEYDSLLKEKREAKRIQRLLKVREQSKKHSQDLLKKHSKEDHALKEYKINQARKRFQETKEAKLKKLRAQYEMALIEAGQAKEAAKLKQQRQVEKATAQFWTYMEDQENAAKRYKQALRRERHEQRKFHESDRLKTKRREMVSKTEAKRTKQVLQQQQQQRSTLDSQREFHAEIDRVMLTLNRETTLKDKDVFESTHYHQHPNTPPSPPSPAVLRHDVDPQDGQQSAALEEARVQASQRDAAARKKSQRLAAIRRYNHAYQQLLREKECSQEDDHLQKMALADRRRKQRELVQPLPSM